MGPAALLDHLELHLGISSEHIHEGTRILNYRNQLEKSRKESFYEESFETSAIEVSRYLLSIRDELKIAGWDFRVQEGMPTRLKNLASVEHAGSLPPARAERLRRAIEEIKNGRGPAIDEILVYEPEELNPPYLAELFDCMIEHGVAVNYQVTEIDGRSETNLDKLRLFALGKLIHKKGPDGKPIKIQPDAGDDSLKIVKLPNNLAAGEEIARIRQADPQFSPVILNERKDPSLSLALLGKGYPSSGTPVPMAVNPEIQFIHSVAALQWKGKDVRKIVDFLTAPAQVIPDSLRFGLAEAFCNRPGINFEPSLESEREKTWGDCLAEFEKKAENSEWAEKVKRRVEEIFSFESFEYGQGAPVENVRELFSYFQKAFQEKAGVIKRGREKDKDPAPWFRVSSALKELDGILDSLEPGTCIKPYELEQYVSFLTPSVEKEVYPREVGSLVEVTNPGLILKPAGTILWFGFASVGENPTVNEAFSEVELTWLEEQGFHLDTAERRSRREAWHLTRFLACRHDRLILVTPVSLNGERSQPHPFMPYLEACFMDIHLFNSESFSDILPSFYRTTKIKTDPFPEAPAYWQINGEANLLGKREKPESFSSLEKLVQNPYQWVLTYKAYLRPGFHGQFNGDPLMLGNLAHGIFQRILTPDSVILDKQTLRDEYRKIADDEMQNQGWCFLQKGYETTHAFIRERLFEHLWTLVHNLNLGGWVPIKCEQKEQGLVGQETVKGYLDLLLGKKNSGEKAIVDLKWGRYKYRREEMNDNRDFQLAVYSKISSLPENFIPTAYFILSKGILLSRSQGTFPGGILCGKGELNQDYRELTESIAKSAEFRRRELSQGKIEVGQDMNASLLEIFQDETRFHPDSSGQKTKKKKVAARYDDFKTFIDSK